LNFEHYQLELTLLDLISTTLDRCPAKAVLF
jgi:hypothetical protein